MKDSFKNVLYLGQKKAESLFRFDGTTVLYSLLLPHSIMCTKIVINTVIMYSLV